MVEDVEEFRAELNFGAFSYRNGLLECDVRLPEIGCAKRIPTERTIGLASCRQLESGPVEVAVQLRRTARPSGIPDQIWTHCVRAAEIRNAARGIDIR